MSRLQWKDEYSVGDAEIDLQHKNLFSLIDRLEDKTLDAAAMSIAFEKLDIYVREHFADEEEKMRACNYPDLEAHLRLHEEFYDWLESCKQSFRGEHEDVMAIGHNLQVFLRDWFLSHVVHADQGYKDWLNK